MQENLAEALSELSRRESILNEVAQFTNANEEITGSGLDFFLFNHSIFRRRKIKKK